MKRAPRSPGLQWEELRAGGAGGRRWRRRAGRRARLGAGGERVTRLGGARLGGERLRSGPPGPCSDRGGPAPRPAHPAPRRARPGEAGPRGKGATGEWCRLASPEAGRSPLTRRPRPPRPSPRVTSRPPPAAASQGRRPARRWADAWMARLPAPPDRRSRGPGRCAESLQVSLAARPPPGRRLRRCRAPRSPEHPRPPGSAPRRTPRPRPPRPPRRSSRRRAGRRARGSLLRADAPVFLPPPRPAQPPPARPPARREPRPPRCPAPDL